MSRPTSPWLSGFGWREDPRARVFSLPYAGGRCTVFRDWPGVLGDEIEVVAVQYPGRGARLAERPLADAQSAAHDIVDAISPLLDRPYVLFGHCMGALLAFEVARILDGARARLPEALIVAARQAPHLPWAHAPLSQLSADELLDALAFMGGTPEHLLVDRAALDRALPSIRSDLRIEERYRYVPAEPLPIPITAWGGEEDKVTSDQLGAWATQTRAGFRLQWFPGGHFFIETHRDLVVDGVARALGPASTTRSPGRLRAPPPPTDQELT